MDKVNRTSIPPRLHGVRDILIDFSAAPFRLFFLTACVVAIPAALCWFLSFAGILTNVLYVKTDPLSLHAFAFLQSLTGAAYAGFLFTAIPEWTHDAMPLQRHMQRLWLLWLVPTVLAIYALNIALAAMLAFWSYMLLLAIWLVWKNRDDRQISVLIFVGSYIAMSTVITIDAWYHGVVNPFYWQQLLHLNLLGIALITFRISRALGSQALEDAGYLDSLFIPNPYFKNLAVWLFYLLVLVNLTLENSVIEGWISLAIGGVMIGRLREWHFWVLLKCHYVRWLYLTLLVIGIGYTWRGLALIGFSNPSLFHHALLNPVLPMHLISISGFLFMVYQVFNIAGLRHSDLELCYPQSSRFALLCLLLAGLSRSLGVGLLPQYYVWTAVYIPGLLVATAFIIYLPVFYRLFIRYKAIEPGE